MMMDLELDVDALQLMTSEEAGLEFEPNGHCGQSCYFTCAITCFWTS